MSRWWHFLYSLSSNKFLANSRTFSACGWLSKVDLWIELSLFTSVLLWMKHRTKYDYCISASVVIPINNSPTLLLYINFTIWHCESMRTLSISWELLVTSFLWSGFLASWPGVCHFEVSWGIHWFLKILRNLVAFVFIFWIFELSLIDFYNLSFFVNWLI